MNEQKISQDFTNLILKLKLSGHSVRRSTRAIISNGKKIREYEVYTPSRVLITSGTQLEILKEMGAA